MSNLIYRPILKSSKNFLPIKINKVNLSLGGKDIFNNLSLNVKSQKITAITGPNGSGKTLLLKIMSGLINPNSGEITYGSNSMILKKHISFVFQNPIFLRRSLYNNMLHSINASNIHFKNNKEKRNRIDKILEENNILHLSHMSARKLSGGEKQKASLARALLSRPSVLFLDEPFTNLDEASEPFCENIIKEASDSGVKIFIISHSKRLMKSLCDEIIFLRNGEIAKKDSP
tara:strand:- start:14 stop:706 length:693 start_codon:yes stop_codon:yes gene_type:complete